MKLYATLCTLVQSLFVLSAFATPNPLTGSSDIVVRDPAIWHNPDTGKYYTFSTGGGIEVFTSTALTGPWARSGSVMPSNCSVINHVGNCTPWAPDVNFVNGQYVLYYAVSLSGQPVSAIGVATSPSMDNGTWDDLGEVFSSTSGDNYNAIDANLINWNGLKLTYGSYQDGIFQVNLTDIKTVASNLPGAHLAGANQRPAEGGFVYKPSNSSYYFLFFSDGTTPLVGATTRPPPGAEYKVLVGRGTGASGPFYDNNGHDLTLNMSPPTGTLVLGSHDNIYAPGGQSVYLDLVSQRDIMVYHYVPNNAFGGPSYLGISYLDFSSGWPVIAG